jgi:hypothetical protein
MFRKYILAGCFFLLMSNNLWSQDLTFDLFTNQLLFNIYTPHPDKNIVPFLKRYVPALNEKINSNPPAAIDTALGFEEIHSFLFRTHPYVSVSFKRGKLDIQCKRFEEREYFQQIMHVKLWFEFEDQTQAEIAFSRLVDNYILLSTDKKFSAQNGSQKAEFMNTKKMGGFNRVQFRLTVDNISEYRYKILFETTNSL